MLSLFQELQRRNVTRTAIAYLAAAWLIVEVCDTILPQLGFTDAAMRNVLLLLAIGFLPALVLSWFFELTPEGIQRDFAASADPAATPRTHKTTDRVIVLMLLAAVGFLAVDRFILDPERDEARIAEAVKQAQEGGFDLDTRDRSIAVLAFADLSPGRDQAYFSEGIAEEILNVLSNSKALRVISRSSAFSFKDSDATIPEIADKLKVSYILEGSVRKAGNRLRITAQLIDARTDTHIWSANYNRTLEDVFAIQDEISEAIVDRLQLTLLDARPMREKIAADAYEKFLRAQYIVHSSNLNQMREAQRLLREVLEVAPDFIPALNALARLYYQVPVSQDISPAENLAEIHRLAQQVITLDPDGADGLIWQGWLAFESNNLAAAAAYYERAIAIAPNNTSLLRVLIGFLSRINRHDDAVRLGRYLLARDPACESCASAYAGALRQTGRPREAATALEDMIAWRGATQVTYWSLGVSWLAANEPQRALDVFERHVLDGLREMGTLMALHDLQLQAEFDARFERFLQGGPSDPESVARVYAWTGDANKAFPWIDKAIEMYGSRVAGWIDTELYNKIKDDPRWSALQAQHRGPGTERLQIPFHFELPEANLAGT